MTSDATAMTDASGSSPADPQASPGFWQRLACRLRGSPPKQVHCADTRGYPEDDRLALYELARRPTSLTLRHLDCGSCNGCEQQLLALANPFYDMEAYGIAFEASPRHAVYLAMTGSFTRGLADAAVQTLKAMPEPAIIAIGDCAVNGGPFRQTEAMTGNQENRWYALAERPPEFRRKGQAASDVQWEVPGCPPTPAEILGALARFVQSRRHPSQLAQ